MIAPPVAVKTEPLAARYRLLSWIVTDPEVCADAVHGA